MGEQTGAGTFTPAHKEILGNPYRNGGSVNMFGIQQAVGGSYSNSPYDFQNDFTSTYSHAFSCDISVQVYHAEQTIHHNAEGVYVITGDFGASENAIRGNCAAFTAQGSNDPQPDWWGEPFHGGSPSNPHCRFEGTAAFHPITTLDVKAFATLGQLFTRSKLARDTRVTLAFDNLLNDRQRVEDRFGTVPQAYQPVRLDPVGRTVLLEIRKVF